MRIYLNTNILCRPFDDLTQERIKNEADASNKIFLWTIGKLITIIISDVLLSEIDFIKHPTKRDNIYHLLKKLSKEMIEVNEETIRLADKLFSRGIITDYMDILHLVCAFLGRADFFITCDNEVVINREGLEKFFQRKIKIFNPVDFIREMEVKI